MKLLEKSAARTRTKFILTKQVAALRNEHRPHADLGGPVRSIERRCNLVFCNTHQTPNRDTCRCETWFPRPGLSLTNSNSNLNQNINKYKICIFVTDTRPITVDLRHITEVTATSEWWALSYAINFLYAQEHGYRIERHTTETMEVAAGGDVTEDG